MNIGILTFYRVANFGANLQALSTYSYLKNRGYNPIFIYYESERTEYVFKQSCISQEQKFAHLNFVDNL